MDRKQFLAALIGYLPQGIDEMEKSEFLEYYDTLIRDFVADGYTEEEAVAMIGDPREVVAQAEFTQVRTAFPRYREKQRLSVGILLLLILGFPLWGSLSLAAVCLLFSAYLLLWTPLLVIASLAFGFTLGGGGAMLLSPLAFFDGLAIGMAQLGSGMLLLGLGFVCCYLTRRCLTWSIVITKNTLGFFANLLKRSVAGYGF